MTVLLTDADGVEAGADPLPEPYEERERGLGQALRLPDDDALVDSVETVTKPVLVGDTLGELLLVDDMLAVPVENDAGVLAIWLECETTALEVLVCADETDTELTLV